MTFSSLLGDGDPLDRVEPLWLGGEEVGGGEPLDDEALRALAASCARYAEY